MIIKFKKNFTESFRNWVKDKGNCTPNFRKAIYYYILNQTLPSIYGRTPWNLCNTEIKINKQFLHP